MTLDAALSADISSPMDATIFAPGAPEIPFGIDSKSPRAIQALRALADAMERGDAVVMAVQTASFADQMSTPMHIIHIECRMSPF